MAIGRSRQRSPDVARLALFGVLERGPASGYEVRSAMKRWHMDWWADVQPGSIYSALKKMEADGFVRLKDEGRNGNRPAHRIYEMTAAGQEEFRRLLRDAWRRVSRVSRPIDLAVSFYDVLSRDEIVELLEARLEDLVALVELFDPMRPPETASDAQFAVITDLLDHERRLTEGEIDWTRSLLERMKGSAYPAGYPRSARR
jgi:DNA-binding PadR family transcriptional regulator